MPSVVVQAGHEGGIRNSGTGSKPSLGASGVGVPERELTPVVADQVTATLQAHGVTVIRENGFFDKVYSADILVALHFDGNVNACASGASIGYPTGSPPGSNKPYADAWRDVYTPIWPFKWMPDNFTGALSGYYGYSWVNTTLGEFLIEFGEISCPEQYNWLKPRVDNGYLGALVAHAIGIMLNIPIPHPDQEDESMQSITKDSGPFWIAWLQRRILTVYPDVVLPGGADGKWSPELEAAVARFDPTPAVVGGNNWADLEELYLAALGSGDHDHDDSYAKKVHDHPALRQRLDALEDFDQKVKDL